MKSYLLAIVLIASSVLLVLAPEIESYIPPTPAFKLINTTTGNITANSYSDFVEFIAGSGITISPNFATNEITFTAAGGNATSPNELYCVLGEWFNLFNATTGNFGCSRVPVYENNTASNLSPGTGLFASKSGVDLRFKSLAGGSGITLSNNATTVTITNTGTGENTTAANLGTSGHGVYESEVSDELRFKKIACTGLTCTNNSTNITLTVTGGSGEANTQSSPTHANTLVLAKSGVDLPIKGVACNAGITCTNNSTDVTVTLTNADKTDITVSAAGATWTIDNDVVTYAKMQNVAGDDRFLGRISGAAGDTEELTGTQATTLLDVFTSALKGLAPASGGGTTNFLRADGTWAVPAGGGGGPTVLNADVTCTLTAAYCTVFTIPLTASSGNRLDVQMVGDSNTAGGSIQMRVQFDNAGNTGYCTYRTYTGAAAETLDVLAATAATDTGETAWLAGANIPMPLDIHCGFETDASPGNALVQVQNEVASTITIQKGSNYIKTP